MVRYQLLWLQGRQSFQPLMQPQQLVPDHQYLGQQRRLVLDPQWLERLPSPQSQQLAFQPLKVQYQPLLLCQIPMVRCQLLWLQGWQSLQLLTVQYQPSLLFQLL
jgi:hypothetical protein